MVPPVGFIDFSDYKPSDESVEKIGLLSVPVSVAVSVPGRTPAARPGVWCGRLAPLLENQVIMCGRDRRTPNGRTANTVPSLQGAPAGRR